MYKLYVFTPDDEKTILAIIDAAAGAGAGQIGRYSECAFVHKGWGQWRTGEGAAPFYGSVGEVSRMNEVKIEMRCPPEYAQAVKQAVIAVHPFEEVSIEFVRLEEI